MLKIINRCGMSVSEFFVSLRDEYFVPAFQKMALSYSVNTNLFYDAVHSLENPSEIFDVNYVAKMSEDEDVRFYNRQEEAYKSNRRLHQIIKRLAIEDTQVDNSSFFVPKIFDSALHENMVSTYNRVAELMGKAEIRRIVSPHFLKHCLFDIEDAVDLSKHFCINEYALLNRGYVCPIETGRRTAFAFTEFAALICIYLSFYRSSIPTLNRPIETDNQRRRAYKRFEQLSNILYSSDFYLALCRAAIDVISYYCEPDQNQNLRTYINAPIMDIAPDDTHSNEYISPRIAEPLPKIEPRTKSKKTSWGEYYSVHMATYLCTKVFPAVELMLTGILSTNYPHTLSKTSLFDRATPLVSASDGSRVFNVNINSKSILLTSPYADNLSGDWEISEATYWVACELANIIKVFIDRIQESVISLLKCLPESEIFESPTIEEMFHAWNSNESGTS